MFTRHNGFEDDALGDVAAPNQLNDDMDRWISQNLFRIGREQAGRKSKTPVACHIEIRDPNNLDRHTDPATDQCRILQENLRDASPNRSKSNDADAHARNHSSDPSSFRALRMPRTACLVAVSCSTSQSRT